MRGATVAVNRVVAALAGLVLIAAGLFLLGWWNGRFPALPQKSELAGLAWLPTQGWWPWALLGAGIVLALLGLRWLAGHLPDRGVSHLDLTGSGPDGKLIVDAATVASAAAAAFDSTAGIRSARGSIHRDRGQLVARFTATVERQADLHTIAAAADTISAQLQQALQRQDLHCAVQLHAAGRNRAQPRVS